jgi:hypothetical protein
MFFFLLSLLMMFLLLLLSNNSSGEHQKNAKMETFSLFFTVICHQSYRINFFPGKQIGGNYSPNIDRSEEICRVSRCVFTSCPGRIDLKEREK